MKTLNEFSIQTNTKPTVYGLVPALRCLLGVDSGGLFDYHLMFFFFGNCFGAALWKWSWKSECSTNDGQKYKKNDEFHFELLFSLEF